MTGETWNPEPETALPTKRDEWDWRAYRRLWNWMSGTTAASRERYGVGPTPQRRQRMACLLRARDLWLMDVRSMERAEVTQAYADELWADLMQGAERQAAHDVLGNAEKAVRYEPLQLTGRGEYRRGV